MLSAVEPFMVSEVKPFRFAASVAFSKGQRREEKNQTESKKKGPSHWLLSRASEIMVGADRNKLQAAGDGGATSHFR